MFYELRTYTLKPTKLADWLALYKSAALEVQQEHLGNLVGFFTTEIGEVNQVIHLWAYTSRTSAPPAAQQWRPTRAGWSSPARTKRSMR